MPVKRPHKKKVDARQQKVDGSKKSPYLSALRHLRSTFYLLLPKNIWLRRIALGILILLTLNVTTMYAVSQWYAWQNRHKPTELGTTFISDYAQYLGVDPKETLNAVINDLGVKNLRLVSYWDSIEARRGTYDFSNLDWQFAMAEKANVKVSLAIGLRQPRWPECHMPEWAKQETKAVWYPQLRNFMTAVIERYKTSPALQSYQLENEFFLTVFGKCTDFDRQRLIEEAELVKKTDPGHTLIISRSNNGVGLPIGKPRPDLFGVSVYKRVWDQNLTHRYFEYPFPAWFYGSLAGGGKIFTGKDLIIHELQAEAWAPPTFSIKDAPISELYKSMNPERLADRFEYGKATGMKSMDLWGVEWWYQMKTKRGAPELWDTAKAEYQQAKEANSKR